MTPLEQQVKDLEQKVVALENAMLSLTNPAQIDPLIPLAVIKNINLGDLKNVNDAGISNGQLLKYNTSTNLYEPADDIAT